MKEIFDDRPCVFLSEDNPEYSLHLEFAIKKPISFRTAKYLIGVFQKPQMAAADAVKCEVSDEQH